LEAIIVAKNYTSGTYLMGWDNVMPEFNFLQALRTNLFGAWQTHRGLGLPDGMGHAANLPHTLLLWFMSIALPQSMLRYAMQFLMHLTGGIGAYFLITTILTPSNEATTGTNRTIGLAGAFFYMCNLIAIQMFYTPLEAFSIHFAALPWLAWSLTRFLRNPDRKSRLTLFLVFLASTPQFFIPTLILPVAIELAVLTLPFWLSRTRAVMQAGLMFMVVNAFWLAPYLYNLPANAPVIRQAKINQMTSEEVYIRNQTYGDLKNVALLRGFLLDFEDVSRNGSPVYVMDAWRTFSTSTMAIAIETTFAVLALLGILTILVRARTYGHMMPFLGIALIGGAFLANNTPAVVSLMTALRDRFPLIAEAYRFPFTKFSLLYSLGITVLIATGIQTLTKILKHRIVSVLLALTVTALVIIQSWPIFSGHFFYSELKVSLPKDYIALFDYMDKLDHSGKTAYLPETSYWSWKHYNYGYVGSGFLWYGLSQPLLDQAFDPWSQTNETYYWELSYAIYKKDPALLKSVWQKYGVRYIILDGYVLSLGNNKSLLGNDTEQLLSDSGATHTKTIGSINVYERTAPDTSMLRIADGVKSVHTPSAWTDNDIAYQLYGDYRTGDATQSVVFPYGSVFTKRDSAERTFSVRESDQGVTVTPKDSSQAQYAVQIASDNRVYSSSESAEFSPMAVSSCGVLKNGLAKAELTEEGALRIAAKNQRACVTLPIPNLEQASSYLVSVTTRHVSGRPLMLSLINTTASHTEVEAHIAPHISGEWQTDYFTLPPLATDGLGYIIYFTNDSIGDTETINDIKIINIYKLPYQFMLDMRDDAHAASASSERMVILAQSYNPGWEAYVVPKNSSPTTKLLARVAPYAFGTKLSGHSIINSWENGWVLPDDDTPTTDIFVFYWPQVLEWCGFLVLFMVAPAIMMRITHEKTG
jgi:hypothetical protein